ncbi:hypothetical protein QTP88_000726 [Uroleucon formosanum]
MNQEIFREWFEKKFIPQVREHLKSQILPQKAVFLIDNAPSHPVDLKSEDGTIFSNFCLLMSQLSSNPWIRGVENTLIGEKEEEVVSAFDLANFSKSLTGGENVDEENINEWINCDANDPGFERLSDEKIVSGALGTVLESEGEEEKND